MKKKSFIAVLLCLLMVLSGCTAIINSSQAAKIELHAAKTSINLSSEPTVTINAIIKDQNKNTIAVAEKDITWHVNDPTKAKLATEQGSENLLTALAPGTVQVTAKYGKLASSPLAITILGSDSFQEPILLFSETFDNVPTGTSIKDHTDGLDNPTSITGISGRVTVNSGIAEMGSQRFALEIPGLATASNPILRVTIKNDNGSGAPVSNLKLALGNIYSSGGAVGADGYRAHGEYAITKSEFYVLEVELDQAFINSGQINFRGIVGSSGTAGLFIDKIEVWDIDGANLPPDPSNPDPIDPDPIDPDPIDPDPIEPPIITPPPTVIDDAYFGLVGWASENGGTTGGTGCPEDKILYIDNGTELYDALYANERRHKGDKSYGPAYPLIIYITGEITKDNTGVSKLTNKTIDKIDLKDQSNVSIIGVGDIGEFDGVGISLRRANNIIIQNLTIHHVNQGEKKAIDVTTDSRNIWIDHCTFYSDLDHGKDYYDGLVDVKAGAQYVTISWNIFRNHYKTSLVGHTDSLSEAPDKVTYHHNYFYNVNSRTPLIRYAEVHLFNNYFHDIKESGVNVRMGGKARVENNYFVNVGNGNLDSKTKYYEGPIGWWYGSSEKGYWEVIDNIFINNSVNEYESTTTVYIPYDYGKALNTAERAKELVLKYAGAGVF